MGKGNQVLPECIDASTDDPPAKPSGPPAGQAPTRGKASDGSTYNHKTLTGETVQWYRIKPSGTPSKMNKMFHENIAGQEEPINQLWEPKTWSLFVQHTSNDFVFDPNSNLKFIWDCLIVIGVAWNSVSIPLYLAFPFTVGVGVRVINIILVVLFLIDVVFNFRTAVPGEHGMMITEPRKIIQVYCRSRLVVDILSIISFDLIFGSSVGSQTLRILESLKLVRLLRLPGLTTRVMERINYPRVMRLCKLLGAFVLLVHWFACVWAVAVLAGDQVWLKVNYPRPMTTSEYYALCFYKGFLVLTTKHINPITPLEQYICSACIFFGSVLSAIIFGNITVLIRNLGLEMEMYSGRMASVHGELSRLGVDKSTQDRVEAYFDHLWWGHRAQFMGSNFVSTLSLPLQQDIRSLLYRTLVDKVDFLKKCANQDFIQALISFLRPMIFLMGDLVFVAGQRSNGMYFVKQGQVMVFKDDKDFVALSSGAVFGEMSLLLNEMNRTASVRSTTVTDLLFLSKDTFEECLRMAPEVKKLLERQMARKVEEAAKREKNALGKAGAWSDKKIVGTEDKAKFDERASQALPLRARVIDDGLKKTLGDLQQMVKHLNTKEAESQERIEKITRVITARGL